MRRRAARRPSVRRSCRPPLFPYHSKIRCAPSISLRGISTSSPSERRRRTRSSPAAPALSPSSSPSRRVARPASTPPPRGTLPFPPAGRAAPPPPPPPPPAPPPAHLPPGGGRSPSDPPRPLHRHSLSREPLEVAKLQQRPVDPRRGDLEHVALGHRL